MQVIVSKTLEDSRREVLEEEEMKNIQFQMEKFKLLQRASHNPTANDYIFLDTFS